MKTVDGDVNQISVEVDLVEMKERAVGFLDIVV